MDSNGENTKLSAESRGAWERSGRRGAPERLRVFGYLGQLFLGGLSLSGSRRLRRNVARRADVAAARGVQRTRTRTSGVQSAAALTSLKRTPCFIDYFMCFFIDYQ